jgi:hypothetical protein
MSSQPPTDRDRDNSRPPPPGLGPKPEFDERFVRSTRLRPRSAEPGKPASGPEQTKDPAAHRVEQLEEYHRRLRTGRKHGRS